ncbi:hypothetical protein JOB18_029275 [Solea senegalensis]|uniref:Uncharacterized protein n=1 Tax=Solea senegalensis TaxID=28829 RepID=A0AAV6SKM6_SOLSE|nr:hypothetical protein JOB18_029275 [Solea senegalensis]
MFIWLKRRTGVHTTSTAASPHTLLLQSDKPVTACDQPAGSKNLEGTWREPGGKKSRWNLNPESRT